MAMHQPPVLPSSHSNAPSGHHQSHGAILSPIPAPEPFAMFFENNYLSQPHKHSGARTEADLLHLAQDNWKAPEFANQRRLYETQAARQRARYDEANQAFEPKSEQQQQVDEAQARSIQSRPEPDEDEQAARERDDAEMRDAGDAVRSSDSTLAIRRNSSTWLTQW